MIDKKIYDNYIATHRDFLFNALDYFRYIIAKDDVNESLCINDVEFKANGVLFIYEDVDKLETYRKYIPIKEFLDFANNNYQDGEASMEKKYCPYCKSEQEVEPLGFLAIQLVDDSRIVEYQCTKCGRIIRERKGGKNE